MGKRKTFEEYQNLLLGKQFGRLTVLSISQHIRKSTGKKDGYEAECLCKCGNKLVVLAYCLLSGHTLSCGCLQKEKAKSNIKEAHKWNDEHPEEMKEIRNKGVSSMLKWQKDHPEEAHTQKLNSLNKAHEWQKEHKEEFKSFLDKAHEWQKDHPEEFNIYLKNNINKAHLWNESHPDEMKKIRCKALLKARQWHKEHPIESKLFSVENIKKAHQWHKEHQQESISRIQKGRKNIVLERISKEEREIYDFLSSLEIPMERQVLVEDHFYDFRIKNLLIEYNGSVYHCTKYENFKNEKAALSMQNFKDKSYHVNLRNIAIKNGFNLIQVWDYAWINQKEFIKKLIKEQLDGIANYKEYLDFNNLLNNDYGFNIDGEQIEPRYKWVTTSSPKQVVEESYVKGKVLVYNSGYTKIK